MMLGLLFGFVFVALAVGTKLECFSLKHKAGRFPLALYRQEYFSVFLLKYY